jgi:hypothetical protein
MTVRNRRCHLHKFVSTYSSKEFTFTCLLNEVGLAKSRWQYGLRCRFEAAWFLGLRVRTPGEHECSSLVLVVRVLRRTDLSFRGFLPGVCVSNSVCDLGTATIWRPSPDFGCCFTKKKLVSGVFA